MSASPSAAATMPMPAQKRPREDPSADAGRGDQHDAKRQARDTTTTDEGTNGETAAHQDSKIAKKEPASAEPGPNIQAYTPSPGDTTVFVPANDAEPQPIPSTASNGNTGGHSHVADVNQDESQWLHLRAVINTSEAATIIGKNGENVTVVRRMAGARCTISDYSRGAVERILTISGPIDAVSQAFGLIVRTLLQEPLDARSTSDSKMYPIRLLIPKVLMGAVIGQKGNRIREIQQSSGARLQASDACLPDSTERSLNIHGVADGVHIAVWYVGETLVRQLNEKYGSPAASAYATRSGTSVGAGQGGMTVIPYNPTDAAAGPWGHPSTFGRVPAPPRSAAAAYGQPQQGFAQQMQPQPMHYGGGGRGYMGAGPATPQTLQDPSHAMNMQAPAGPNAQAAVGFPGQPLTQQIYIPNDMVGAIIGKGGAKINEIRQLSGSVIKINEPSDSSNERLVTITGTQNANQTALYLLYQRLGKDIGIDDTEDHQLTISSDEDSEKHRA